MTALDEKALDRAWEAFGNTPIDIHGDTDDEQRKCLAAGIEAFLTALPQSPVGELVTFLNEAAGYFDRRDTGGEDRAHWANVFNAENCRKAATALLALQAENERLKRAALTEIANLGQEIEAAESKAEGMVMVPVEPTHEMIEAGADSIGKLNEDVRDGFDDVDNETYASVIWRRMIAAAPSDKVVKVESMGKAK